MDLNKMNRVEAEKLDVSPYVGKMARIEKVEELETQFGVAIKVSSEIIDTIKTAEEKEDIELRATRVFSISKDGNIIIGSKLDKFMEKQKVDQPLKLVGTEIQVLKNDKDFLTF